MTRELKGRHVFLIAISAFAVIIAANLTMLFAATGSFPGLVVKNSYIASQGWNERTAEQEALGWTTDVVYSDGAIEIDVTTAGGVRVQDVRLIAIIGRPATDTMDQTLPLSGPSPYTIPVTLAPGKWMLRLKAEGNTPFSTTASLFVPGAN